MPSSECNVARERLRARMIDLAEALGDAEVFLEEMHTSVLDNCDEDDTKETCDAG